MEARILQIDRDGVVQDDKTLGIGAHDCQYSSFHHVLKVYIDKFDKLPLKLSNYTYMFELEDSYVYLTLQNIYKFQIGMDVRSNNNNSRIRFDEGVIVSRYVENFYPYYTVRIQGSMFTCREIDLIQARL